jgi:hypothetical protein
MSEAPKPYGTCTFESDGVPYTVTLHFDAIWTTDPPIPEPAKGAVDWIMADLIAGDNGPSTGPWGSRILSELARRLHGTYRMEPRQSPPPGTVY